MAAFAQMLHASGPIVVARAGRRGRLGSERARSMSSTFSGAGSPLRHAGATRAARRPRFAVAASSEEDAPSGASFPASDMAVLNKRMKQLKQKSVEEVLQTALNWRQGVCNHIVVARIDDWVRKVRFQMDVLCLGTHGGLLMLVDLSKRGSVVAVLSGLSDEITALDFDGQRVIAGTIDGEVGIWTADAEGVFKGGLVGNVGATCTGVHLGAGGMATAVSLKGRVVVWEDGDYGKPADTLELCEAVSTMHFGDGYAFAGLRDGRVMVYSCAEGRLRGSGKKAAVKEILSFAAHTAEVTCVQFLKGEPDGDGDIIVTGSFDGTLKTWDLEGSKLVHTFKGHLAAVSCLQADTEKLVSGARDGSIRVWSMRDGAHRYCITGHTAYLDALQFEGARLIASGTNNVVVLHDFAAANPSQAS